MNDWFFNWASTWDGALEHYSSERYTVISTETGYCFDMLFLHVEFVIWCFLFV